MKNRNRKMFKPAALRACIRAFWFAVLFVCLFWHVIHYKTPQSTTKTSCGDAAEQKLQTLSAEMSLRMIQTDVKWTSLNSSTGQRNSKFIHKHVHTLHSELNLLPTFWPLWHYKRCAVDIATCDYLPITCNSYTADLLKYSC